MLNLQSMNIIYFNTFFVLRLGAIQVLSDAFSL